jgi:hypothetical protein
MTDPTPEAIAAALALAENRDADISAIEMHGIAGDVTTIDTDSIVASCNCDTKTNEVIHHKPGCKYRLISERDDLRAKLAEVEKDRKALLEKLDWQNKRNSGQPTRGGFEFYINEEWTGLASAALDEEAGWRAGLRKMRIDPDDERVRVRRVIEDDEMLFQLSKVTAERDDLRRTVAELKIELTKKAT